MILIVSKYLIPKGFNAIAFYPFIVVGNHFETNNSVLLNHERIHLKQQKELLILPFYLLYFIDYLIKMMVLRDKNQAYKNIVFEREAYAHENDMGYLKSRPIWNWRRYFKN